MSLTQQARRNHSIYEALPKPYRDAIDNAFDDVQHAIIHAGLGLNGLGDDRAEVCVSAITQYVIESNPEDAAIKATIAEVDAPDVGDGRGSDRDHGRDTTY